MTSPTDRKMPDDHEEFEKVDVEEGATIASKDPNHEDGFTKKEQKRVKRKIDLRLVTGLGLLMGVCLMDRTNLGSTSIAGYVL